MSRLALRLAAAMVLAAGASSATAQELADLSWMAGAWMERKDGVDTEEHWLSPKGGMLVAMNRTVRANGRTSFELLRIEMRDGKPVYLAQPGGRPATEFKTAEYAAQKIVFENPEKEFPRRISYWRDGEALIARTEGRIRGEPVAEQWRFERQK
jgi:hypothetical protein